MPSRNLPPLPDFPVSNSNSIGLKTTRSTSPLSFWLAIVGLSLCFSFPSVSQTFDCEEELFSKKDKKTRLFGYVNMLGEYRVPPTFLKAMPFSGKYAVVQQGKKFGVINCEGILVVPADYDEIASFINGKGWMKINNLWGLVDFKGKILIQPTYEEVQEINTFNGTVTWVKKGGLWGLISRETGRMLVAPSYEAISTLSDSAGIGRKNGLQDLVYYGDGRVIIPQMRQVKKAGPGLFIYQNQDRKFGAFNRLAFITIRPNLDSLFQNESFFQTLKFGKYGLVNPRGNVLFEPEYDFISTIRGGFAGFTKEGNFKIAGLFGIPAGPEGSFTSGNLLPNGLAVYRSADRAGLWDLKQKKWLVPFEKQTIRIASNENWMEIKPDQQLARAYVPGRGFSASSWDSLETKTSSEWIRAYLKDKIQLVQLPDCQPGKAYDQVLRLESNWFLVKSESKSGIANPNGMTVFPCEYESILTYHLPTGDPLFVLTKNGTTGLANQNGKLIVPMQYEGLLPTISGPYPAKQKGKWGLAETNGKWLSYPQYDSITGLKYNGRVADFPLVGWRKGKGALLSAKGAELSEATKNKWIYLGQEVFGQETKEGVILISHQGKRLENLVFDQVEPFSEGNAPAKQNGKWGFVNAFGRLVIPARFDEVLPFKSGVAFARQNGLWGVLKKNGTWLQKPIGIGVSTDEGGNRKIILPK